MVVHVDPLTTLIGAEVRGVDLRQPLAPSLVKHIRAQLLQRKVLFFRDQELTDEQHMAFAAHFGQLTLAHPIAPGMAEHKEIWERDAEGYKARRADISVPSITPPRRDYIGWHIDVTFVENPVSASVLRGVVIPDHGGDTLWSNLAAAYNGLSPKMRAFIDRLQAVHRAAPHYLDANGKVWAALHPVVRVHPETGEKALFMNPGTITHIHDLREAESTALLELLANAVMRPEYQVRFKWAPGSVAFWDNRITAHVGPVDYTHLDSPRVIRRVSLAGDVPVGPDGFRSRLLYGRPFLPAG